MTRSTGPWPLWFPVTPSSYVQDARGKRLHHQQDYQRGAAALAQTLRQADPSYQPAQDPDRRKGVPLLPWGLPWSVPVGLLLVAGVIFYHRTQRRSA